MADRKIGTVFVELDLDSDRYLKGQQKLYKEATSTSLSIEENFKRLGIKTAAEYDLMRSKIENSYQSITRSAKASADDILRAEKARNDQLARLNEQQFGHQKSTIDGLKTHWIAATVAIGAASAVAMKGWQLAKQGADFEEQKGILDNLSRKYGQTADSIVSDMARASDGLVANADLMQIALGGVAKGLKPDQLTNLADAARILGDAAGKDATTALNELTQALETGRAKGLKGYMGTALDLKEVFGDLESKLSDTEKAQAMYSLAMAHATKLQAAQSKEVDDTADKIERLEAKYKNLVTTMSRAARWALADIAESIERYTGERPRQQVTMDAQGRVSVVEGSAKSAAPPTGNPDEIEQGASMRLEVYNSNIAAIKAKVQAQEDAKKADKEFAAYEKKAREDSRKDLIASIEAETKEDEDGLIAQAKALDESLTARKSMEDEDRKALFAGIEAQTKDYEDGLRANADAQDKANEKAVKSAADRQKAERDLYADLRGYETEAYQASMAMISSQADAFQKLGVDEVAISVWVAEEHQKAELKKLKSSKDWKDGVSAFYKESRRDAKDWGDYSYDIAKSLAENSEKALSDNLFDAIKGDFENIGQAWDSLFDSMLRKLTDTVANMATQWAINATAAALNPYASMAGSAIAAGASWLWDYAIGFAEGAYNVNEDMITKVHKGEMIIPADLAALLREGSGPDPGEAWAESAPQMGPTSALDHALDTFGRGFMEGIGRASLGKELGALVMAGQLTNPIGVISTISSLISSIGAGVGAYGQYSTFANIAELAVNGPALSNYSAPSRSFSEIMAGLQEAMSGLFGGGSVSGGGWSGAQGDMGGPGGEPSGQSHGDPSGDMGGPGGEPGDSESEGGWKYGGIPTGPDSGHWEKLHGTEAVVPLPNGKSIPVEMKSRGTDGAALPPILIRVELDGWQIAHAMIDQNENNHEYVVSLRKAVN